MKTLLSILSLCLVLAACSKSGEHKPTDAFNCINFKSGLSTGDHTAVGTEVNKLCTDLYPAITNTVDEYGQAQNINLLVQRLSAQCDVTASLVCYSCIETLPAQSEIKVTFDFYGTTYERVLDITVTPQHMLIFSNSHE